MEGKRLIKSIRLRNLLSYGSNSEEILLEPLNVLIGQKGAYHKIKHGSELLKRIDSGKVRNAAPHCEGLFTELTRQIEPWRKTILKSACPAPSVVSRRPIS